MTANALSKFGPRPGVIQVAPTLVTVRPRVLHDDEDEEDVAARPLEAPTGPGGAPGFHNVAASQIAVPHVTNVYVGKFWSDRAFLEEFSLAIVERGYLDPLHELHYGTGSGSYMGPIDVPSPGGKDFHDANARAIVAGLLDQEKAKGDGNSLFVLILPDGVTAVLDDDGSRSCRDWCGYHDAFAHKGTEIAYAVLPSTRCSGCGGKLEDLTAVYAHELAEAVTDKVPGQGWVASDGSENADLEAWVLLGWGPPTDPKRFTIQGYYTNERGNTVGAWRSGPAPSARPARSG